MSIDSLRSLIQWHEVYRREWDDTPDMYAEHDLVGWGRSRRLGLFRSAHVKAYLGVQHIDPSKPGWDIVEEPEACFFLSLFVAGQCVALRTFPQMEDALQALDHFLQDAIR